MTKFKKGDSVKLYIIDSINSSSPVYGRIIYGKVVDIKNRGTSALDGPDYLIKYDDIFLIPPEDWHKEKDLYLVDSPASRLKCECGVSFVRHGGKHSTYCPLYDQNE